MTTQTQVRSTEEALKLALEALQAVQPECDDFHHKKKEMHDWSEICKPLERYNQAITAIKEVLEKPDYEKAYLVWQDKTEWVQETVEPHELGMHRADVLRQRIEALAQQSNEQVEPVAWQDTVKPDELVSAEDWDNIDPMYKSFYRPLYTHPFAPTAQRKPLVASDIVTMYDESPRSDSEMIVFARAIEAAHGIKE